MIAEARRDPDRVLLEQAMKKGVTTLSALSDVSGRAVRGRLRKVSVR